MGGHTPLPEPSGWNARPIDNALLEQIARHQAGASGNWKKLQSKGLHRLAEIGIPAPRHELFSYGSPSSLFSHLRNGSIEADNSHPFFSFRGESEQTPLSPNFEELASAIDSNSDPIALLASAINSHYNGFSLAAQPEPHRVALELPAPSPAMTAELELRLEPQSRAVLSILPSAQPENGAGWHHLQLTIWVEEGSHLQLDSLQLPTDQLIQTGTVTIHLAKEAKLQLAGAWFGAPFGRHSFDLHLDGEKSHAAVMALTIVGEKRQQHHHLTLHHHHPSTTSEQRFHQAVLDRATVSVDGEVRIDRGADLSSSDQLIRTLLLGDGATAAGKPRLVIEADDVEATHGATHGPLEEEELFYLETRGLTPEAATAALIEGFAHEISDRFSSAELRQQVEEQIDRQLSTVIKANR